jgi:ABC-2 type transport system permease protein
LARLAADGGCALKRAMLDKTTLPGVAREPGVTVIPGVNWQGLQTLYLKEVRRFFKVQLQTVWAPAITTLLFLVIFALALGRSRQNVMGVPYADFLGPGLIVMGMIQNSFANTSSSLLIAKIQGTIVDVLMPPLSSAELLVAWVGGAVTRAWLVGGAVYLVMLLAPGVDVPISNLGVVVYFGTMGAVMLALLGILTGIWADKFDHAAAITNFVVQPLTLLSGTFYAIDKVSPAMRTISHANPFFYIIDGFRYGFLGVADGLAGQGAVVLLVIDVLLWAVCYRLLKTGWRLKN